ncbi:MAG: glycosyltransferase family 2 protein [Chloroflexota bacterium]|nr:glycosyltransferase family 2 protein [Chloroflexota bacterium]
MNPAPTISVIIPTYNRKNSLLRTLDSLTQQTIPMERLEVIVVDDGSPDDTQTLTNQQYPFTFRYLQQKNQGATAARNFGATTSLSDVLVFIDDDITISPQTLEALAEECCRGNRILAMGTINKRSSNSSSVYTPVVLTMADHSLVARDDVEFDCVECNSELLACRRQDFFEIGMFQDPTDGHGWPNWDDVDFGYRAHRKGFRILGTSKAIAEHWDYSITDRNMACQRFYRAGRSAVWLFNRHPGLQTLIPMLRDKLPPVWGQDSALLIARKLARHLLSSPPAFTGLVKLVSLLEQHYPAPVVLRRLYYLLHGANLFQGYRDGLREFKLAGAGE